MLLEGFKLMIIGMGTVGLFLTMMVYCLQGIAWMSRHETKREEELLKMEKFGKSDAIASPQEEIPIAVFAAAISAFESDRDKKGRM